MALKPTATRSVPTQVAADIEADIDAGKLAPDTRLPSSHPATRAYVERRTKEGLSKKEIIRCLKRYVAREVYHHLDASG
jgi:DNA-binding transcriptional regulator YhcF (GntR family)